MRQRRHAVLAALVAVTMVIASGCDLQQAAQQFTDGCMSAIGEIQYSGLACLQLTGAIGGGILALLQLLLGGLTGLG